MSQSIITLGIGGTSEIAWLVLTGLHGESGPLLIVADPDNFAFVAIRNKRSMVDARDKRGAVLARDKRTNILARNKGQSVSARDKRAFVEK